MTVQIVIKTPGQPEERYDLEDGLLRIGRSDDCDITVADKNWSRWHLEILKQGERIFVRDVGSTNGSTLGNQQLSDDFKDWTPLTPLVVGDHYLQLKQVEDIPLIVQDPDGTERYQPSSNVAQSFVPPHPAPHQNLQATSNPPSYGSPANNQHDFSARPAMQDRPTNKQKAKPKGCMAFLSAFLSTYFSGHFRTVKYLGLFLIAPVKNSMLVINHYDGYDISADDKYGLHEIEPYKFFFSSFTFFFLLVTAFNFLFPDTRIEINEFGASIGFAGMMLLTIFFTYFVFSWGTGGKRDRDSYLILSSIVSGVQLASLPFIIILFFLSIYILPLIAVALVLYIYVFPIFYYRTQKAFWNTGYLKAFALNFVAAVPAGIIFSVVPALLFGSGDGGRDLPSPLPSNFDQVYTMEIVSGGPIHADSMFGGIPCTGDFPSDYDTFWDYSYWYQLNLTGMYSLQFRVESAEDTVLVIESPNGNFYCNDDTRSNDLNPMITIMSPQAGRYNMWIGNFSGDYKSGILTATINPF